MFGGLNVKQDDDGKESGGAAAQTFSAFGFLNATAPAPAPAVVAAPSPGYAIAGSGFSFLNAPAPAPELAEPSPAPVSTSGFSFLQETKTAVSAPADDDVAAPAESAFSFMIPSPEKAPSVEDIEVKPVSHAIPETTAYSAFNFLSGDSQDEGDIRPAPMHTISTGSVTSVISGPSPESFAPPNMLDIPEDMTMPSATAGIAGGPPGLPAGAGISFGTANKPVVRKKKTRAQKVGMGAPSNPQPAPPQAPAPALVSKTSFPGKETRDAAAEAQRRAEEFMTKKTLAETTVPPTSKPAPSMMTIPTYDDESTLGPSASTDEEVARAQRAAEEAQKISVAGMESRGGFMGTFFKGFGGSTSSINSVNKGSTHTGMKPAIDTSAGQQLEMKRAGAERQIEFPRQSLAGDGSDDVASEPVAEPQPSPPAVFITPTFQPAVPPTKPAAYVVRELASTPKKKKSARQTFEEYQALFAQSVHRAMQQVEAVRSQQKMLTEERFLAIAKQRLSTQQIAQTETQLQVAVDNEDYELADHLGQVVEAHGREMAEVASILLNIAKALEQLESQKALVVRGVATCFDNLAFHIKDMQEDQNARDRVSDAETFKQFEVISKQLSAEQERLLQDVKILERDAQQTMQERKEVEAAISEQAGAFEKQRDDALAKLAEVDEEIAELRRQLEAKSRIAAGLRTEVHGYEDSISKVRVKFYRQVARVDKKEKDLEESRRDWETEMAAHKRQKEAHDLQVQTHSEALLESDILQKTMETELSLCKKFAGMVATKLGFMENDTKSKELEDAENEGNLAQLQADVVKCEAACSEAKVLAKAAMAVISSLETERSMLIVRIPELEAEKKSAAARRDFKAASKASKEIKDATTRLQECEDELGGEAAEKKKAAEDELARLSAELEEARKIAEKEEKISGMARMVDLAKQIRGLVATRKELCGDAKSDDNTVKGVGAFVMESQIKALQDEGQELDSKYGGWHDLIKDFLGGNVETEAEIEAAIPAKPPVDDGLTSEERIAKVRDLMRCIEETEPLIEAAVEREDFEEAARLQELLDNALEKAQSEIEIMNLTDEESQIAFGAKQPEAMAEELEKATSGAEDTNELPRHEVASAMAEESNDAVQSTDEGPEDDAVLEAGEAEEIDVSSGGKGDGTVDEEQDGAVECHEDDEDERSHEIIEGKSTDSAGNGTESHQVADGDGEENPLCATEGDEVDEAG